MIDKVLVGTNIPKNFKRAKYCDYDPERGRISVLKKIQSWEPDTSKPGLLLVGPPGLAKTMLACATLNEFQSFHVPSRMRNVPFAARETLRQMRYPVYFIQIAEWIELQIRLFKLHRDLEMGICSPEEYMAVDNLLADLKERVKMLVVDDVGKEHKTASDFAVDSFDLLVRSRFNRGLPTIFTSNLPVYRWDTEYSKSMQNFIERTCTVIEFRTPR